MKSSDLKKILLNFIRATSTEKMSLLVSVNWGRNWIKTSHTNIKKRRRTSLRTKKSRTDKLLSFVVSSSTVFEGNRRKSPRQNQSSHAMDTKRESSVLYRRIECDQTHRKPSQSHRLTEWLAKRCPIVWCFWWIPFAMTSAQNCCSNRLQMMQQDHSKWQRCHRKLLTLLCETFRQKLCRQIGSWWKSLEQENVCEVLCPEIEPSTTTSINWKNFTQTHWPNVTPFLAVTTNIPESRLLQLNRTCWTRSNFSGITKESAKENSSWPGATQIVFVLEPLGLSPSAATIFDHCQILIKLPHPSEAVMTFFPSTLKATFDNFRSQS